MTTQDQLKQDLDYVSSAVRRHDKPVGEPAIFFLWAVITLVGFTLWDVAPHYTGPFWMITGIGGGLLSMWLGARGERRNGIIDRDLGKRYGLHWSIGGAGFLLGGLPMILGRVPAGVGSSVFLLVAGLLYALAGVHLQRGLLWPGLIMLAAYAVLVIFAPPYTWTLTGIVIAIALTWAGVSAHRAIAQGARA